MGPKGILKKYIEKMSLPLTISLSGFSPHSKKRKKKNLASHHFHFYIQIFPPVSLLKSTDICCFGNRLNTLKVSSPNIQETWLSSLRSLLKSYLAEGWFPNHLFTILYYLVLVLKQIGDYILSVQMAIFDHPIYW